MFSDYVVQTPHSASSNVVLEDSPETAAATASGAARLQTTQNGNAKMLYLPTFVSALQKQVEKNSNEYTSDPDEPGLAETDQFVEADSNRSGETGDKLSNNENIRAVPFVDFSRILDRWFEKLIVAQEEEDISQIYVYRRRIQQYLRPRPRLRDYGLEVYEDNEAWKPHLNMLIQCFQTQQFDSIENEEEQEEARLFMHRLLNNLQSFFRAVKAPFLPSSRLCALDRVTASESSWIDYLCDVMQAMDIFADICLFLQDSNFSAVHRPEFAYFEKMCSHIASTAVWSIVCGFYLEWIEKKRDDVIGQKYDGQWNDQLRSLVLTVLAKCCVDWNSVFVTLDPPDQEASFINETIERMLSLNLRQWGKIYDTHDPEVAFLCDQMLILHSHGLPYLPPGRVIRQLKQSAWFRYRSELLHTSHAAYRALREHPDASENVYADTTCPLNQSERVWNASVVDSIDVDKPFESYTVADAWNVMKWLHGHVFCMPMFSMLKFLHLHILWPVFCKAIVDIDGQICNPDGSINEDLYIQVAPLVVSQNAISASLQGETDREGSSQFNKPARNDVKEDAPIVNRSHRDAEAKPTPGNVWVLNPIAEADIEFIMHHFLHISTVTSQLAYVSAQVWFSDADPMPRYVTESTTLPPATDPELDNPLRPTEKELLQFVSQLVQYLQRYGVHFKNRNLLAEQLKYGSPGYLVPPACLPLQIISTKHIPGANISHLELLEFVRPSDKNGIIACIFESTAPIHMFVSGMGVHASKVVLSMASTMAGDNDSGFYAEDQFAERNLTRYALDSENDGTSQASFIIENMAPLALVTPVVRKEVHDRLALLWFLQVVETWAKTRAYVSVESRLGKNSQQQIIGGARFTNRQTFSAIARENKFQSTLVQEMYNFAMKQMKSSDSLNSDQQFESHEEMVKYWMREFAARKTGVKNRSGANQQSDVSKSISTPGLQTNVFIAHYAVRSLGSLADLRNKDIRKMIRHALPPDSLTDTLYGSNTDNVPRWAPLLKIDNVTGRYTYLMPHEEMSFPRIIGLGSEYLVCGGPGKIFVQTRQWILALKVYTLFCHQLVGREVIEREVAVGQGSVDPVSANVFLGLEKTFE